jgi:hypothetical protein
MELNEQPVTKLVVSSLSALLLALSKTDLSSIQVIYVPIRREKGEISKFRNKEMQAKIVMDVGRVLGFETQICISKLEVVKHLTNLAPKIIDVDTLGYIEMHSKNIPNVKSFVGAGGEILSGFLPVIPSLSIRDFILRLTIIKVKLYQFGIWQIHCFVPREIRALFFWKATPANLNEYSIVCTRIFNGLKQFPEYRFLLELDSSLNFDKSRDLLLVLPVAKHYGGDSEDAIKCIRHMQQKFPEKKFLTLVKNHPSDGNLDLKHLKSLVEVFWGSDLSRTFPVEILLHVFLCRIFLVSSGSSAMFSINSSKRFMFYPGTKFGAYLAFRNTNHLLKPFKIDVVDIHNGVG